MQISVFSRVAVSILAINAKLGSPSPCGYFTSQHLPAIEIMLLAFLTSNTRFVTTAVRKSERALFASFIAFHPLNENAVQI